MVNIEELYQLKQNHLWPSKQTKRNSTISTKKNKEKVNLIVDQGTLLQWISQTTIQHTEGKRSCLQMHGLISWVFTTGKEQFSQHQWTIYQSHACCNNLPRIQVPVYDGSPTKWLEFVVKFKDLVHDLQFLTNTQRMTYLLPNLEGEAKRAVQCFSNDKVRYIMTLKRLKYMFVQKPQICQAYIQKMIREKQIGNGNNKTLMEYYYAISDWIVALSQLKYTSDLFSSDILRKVIRRLLPKFHDRWAEFCFTLRRVKEPTLVDFDSWIQDRILRFKEV